MSDPGTSECALRQAWRQADRQVAKSLAALCYGKASGAGDMAQLSQIAVMATRQRRDLAATLADRSVVQPSPVKEAPARPVLQILHATVQTRALRPPVERPLMSLLRERLSAA